MKYSKQIKGSLLLAALLGLSACGGGGSGSTTTSTVSTATDVTVERGKVYDATVVDSSLPPQTAKQKQKSNVYTFAKKPTYPVVASGGWIDVNDNGVKDGKDVNLDVILKSYSNVITPVTTYIADANKTIRENRLLALKERLNANGVGEGANVDESDLRGLLSSSNNLDFIVLSNAIYKEMKEHGGSLGGSDDDDLMSQFASIRGLSLGTSAKDIEEAVMANLAGSGYVEYIPEIEIDGDTNGEDVGSDDGTGSNDDGSSSGGDTSHPFVDGVSLDISNGITSNSMITMFQKSNDNIEMFFTLGADGTATVQYVENKKAVWQNTLYDYTISGTTISFVLQEIGKYVNLGPVDAPSTVSLNLSDSVINARDTATVDGNTYTVLSASSEDSTSDLLSDLLGGLN